MILRPQLLYITPSIDFSGPRPLIFALIFSSLPESRYARLMTANNDNPTQLGHTAKLPPSNGSDGCGSTRGAVSEKERPLLRLTPECEAKVQAQRKSKQQAEAQEALERRQLAAQKAAAEKAQKRERATQLRLAQAKRRQVKTALKFLDKFSIALGKTPHLDSLVARLREYSEFARFGVGELESLAEDALHEQEKQRQLRENRRQRREHRKREQQEKMAIARLLKSRQRVLKGLFHQTATTPTIDEFVAKLKELPEFSELTSSDLETEARQEIDRRGKKGGKSKRKIKGRARQVTGPKGGDAMSRAVSSGFETSRRRH